MFYASNFAMDGTTKHDVMQTLVGKHSHKSLALMVEKSTTDQTNTSLNTNFTKADFLKNTKISYQGKLNV